MNDLSTHRTDDVHAAAVPDGFRFMVKAPQRITAPYLRDEHCAGLRTNADYLAAGVANEIFLKPLQAGLGVRLGVVVLQFPPQGRRVVTDPAGFAERLGRLLEAASVPGAFRAVELRDPPLLTARLMAVLARTGTGLCVSVHPRMPDLARQLRFALDLEGALVVRWNLQAGLGYEEAKQRFAPFDRLCAEDLPTRRALADAATDAIEAGRPVYITVNNKAEGSAPLSVLRLGEQMASGWRCVSP